MAAVGFALGVDEPPDPDSDLSRPWACSQLLEDLRSGERAAGWSQEVLEVIAAALSAAPPQNIHLTVEGSPVRAEPLLSGVLVEPHAGEELCRPMWSPAARMNQRDPQILRTHLWVPPVLSGPAAGDPAVRWEPTAVRHPDADVFAYESIRIDTTGAVPATALVAFAAQESTQWEEPVRRSGWGEPDERSVL